MNQVVPCQANPEASSQSAASRRPFYTVDRTEQGYRLEVFLPGVTRDDVQLRYEQDTLKLRAKRPGRVAQHQKVLLRETFNGEYGLDLNVEAKIDVESINATFENGVLRADLPLTPEATSRQIAIQ